MIINLTIEISDSAIHECVQNHPDKFRSEILGEINNAVYVGGDCITAILDRQLELPVGDHYILKDQPVEEKIFTVYNHKTEDYFQFKTLDTFLSWLNENNEVLTFDTIKKG